MGALPAVHGVVCGTSYIKPRWRDYLARQKKNQLFYDSVVLLPWQPFCSWKSWASGQVSSNQTIATFRWQYTSAFEPSSLVALARVWPFCFGPPARVVFRSSRICFPLHALGSYIRQHTALCLLFSGRFHRTGEEERLAAEARRPTSVGIDRETRRQLLNYFVFCPPENDQKLDKTGSINAISSSFGNIERGSVTQQGSDAIGSSGRGARFSKSVRDVFSRLPTLGNPTPDPPPLPGATSPPSAFASPPRTSYDIEEAGDVDAQESSTTGECKVPRSERTESSSLLLRRYETFVLDHICTT